ncbi:MAG: hypothetical protein WBD20_00355 [Pirellulaceae bacterium]
MKKHEWREDTDEGVRVVRVSHHAGKWTLQSKLKSADEWTQFPVIDLEDLETLREIIFNKYQRNRLPHEQVLQVEALIEAAKLRG